MYFISVEPPTARVSLTRESLEFLDAPLRIVSAGDSLQVVPDELVQTFAERLGFLAGASDNLVIQRQCDVHEHSKCGHGSCVNHVKTPLSRKDRKATFFETSD